VIASISGTVAGLTPHGAVVTVGGVGLAVLTTPGTRARLRTGEEAFLATSLVVREDSLTLYGFETADERDLFELLQSASGVGPKVAQAVLTVHTPDALRRAVTTEDLTALCLVPGIGRKGAQRMVLELKEKIAQTPAGVSAGAGRLAGDSPWRELLTDALTGLGWSQARADEVVVRLAAEHLDADKSDVPALLREALSMLTPGGAR
jgi:Holliday junction DNA helicase RuvA